MSLPPTPPSPLYRPVGDHGLLVEFGETIAQETHALVLRLDAALSANAFEGFRECVPAYVTVLIDFDPTVADHKTVQDAVKALLGGRDTVEVKGETREVLVCCDDRFASDLRIVTEGTGLGVEELIAAHLQGTTASTCMASLPDMPISQACLSRSSCRANPPPCAMSPPDAS